jgi:hypothetical protein
LHGLHLLDVQSGIKLSVFLARQCGTPMSVFLARQKGTCGADVGIEPLLSHETINPKIFVQSRKVPTELRSAVFSSGN